MRLIDADKLRTIRSIQSGDFNSIETIQKWIGDAPTVEAIPVEWIKKYEKYDDLAASIYRMLEAWGADLSDYEDWEKVNK